MNKAVYLSHPLSAETPLYGGADGIHIEPNTSISIGNTANSLSLFLPNHAGTHVDVPYHFFDDGNKLVGYDASFWIFNHPICIDVPCEDGWLVKYEDVVADIKEETDLLLIRTGYEKFRHEPKYWQKNPGLSAVLARELRLKHPNIRALGVDIISITSCMHREEGRKAHQVFLCSDYNSEPILLIEDMSLSNYTINISQVIVMPLMIKDADGAPCTVIGKVIE